MTNRDHANAPAPPPVIYRLGENFSEKNACELFSQLRQSSAMIAFIADYDSGRMLFIDGPVETLAGASPDVLLQDPTFCLTLCGYPAGTKIEKLHQEMGPAQTLNKVVSGNVSLAGARPLFRLSARGVKWRGQNLIAGSLRNTNQLSSTDENAALNLAISQSREGMALTDPQGVYVFMNAAHARLFGYESSSELLGRSWRMLYTASGIEYLEKTVFPGLRASGDWHGHMLALRKDGTQFHQDLTLSLLADGSLVCNCRDRSREVERFERLAESNKFFREFLDTLPTGVLVRPVDGPYEFVNAAFCAVIDIPPEKVIGQTGLNSILSDKEIGVLARYDQEVAQTRQPVKFDFPLQQRGQALILEVTKLPLFFGQAEPTHLCSLIADVTEKRRMEGVERATAKKRQEYMEMQREFISLVSHEFRTPITVIQGAHYMLMRNLEASHEPGRADSLKLLELQKRALVTLKEQVDQVLLLNRVEHIKSDAKRTDVPLLDLVLRLADNFNSTLPHPRVILENRLPAGWRTPIHEAPLRGAIENLISNGLKYSPDNALVTVGLSQGPQDYTITVSDLGRGIPEADQAKLFQPFFRSGNVGRVTGSGLGLTIVKRVAELHSGRIEYRSVLGQGSTFSLIIPSPVPLSA
jgi:PAS domain S-box-containing protein